MVLDSYRKAADRVLRPIALRLKGVNPNLLSWISLGLAGLTGGLFVLAAYVDPTPILIAAFITLLLSALLDALDGKVARIRGTASKRGDFVDHVFDRYADVLILVGLFFSPYAREWVVLLGTLGVLLTSYMGTQAQAVGVGRVYAGALGRADRLVALLVAIILLIIFDPAGTLLLGIGAISFTVMEYLLLIYGVLGNITAVQRAVGVWRQLKAS